MKQRLQKLLAAAGVCSRREAERLIELGEVTVNGERVARQGTKADPETDRIEVSGRRVGDRRPHLYVALHKPRGYVTTLRDPEGRKTIVELVSVVKERLFPIGRLDYNAEGLLLMTNDGDLAYALMRPGGVPKTYKVKVKGSPSPEALDSIRRGLVLEGHRLLPVKVKRLGHGENSWLLLTLVEGRQNQIVNMMQAIGHPVRRLRRLSVGPVHLGSLPAGRWRALESVEIQALRTAAGLEHRSRGAKQGRGGRRASEPRGGKTAARKGPPRSRAGRSVDRARPGSDGSVRPSAPAPRSARDLPESPRAGS